MSIPVAIIQTLEDYPFTLDRSLISAYLETTYRVHNPAFEIRIGFRPFAMEKWLEEQQAETFAFITAWNPASGLLTAEDNTKRNRLLKQHLSGISRLVLPGAGTGDAGDWPPEESFCALDISPAQAVQVGRDFGQHAIVFWKAGGLPELWWLTLPLSF